MLWFAKKSYYYNFSLWDIFRTILKTRLCKRKQLWNEIPQLGSELLQSFCFSRVTRFDTWIMAHTRLVYSQVRIVTLHRQPTSRAWNNYVTRSGSAVVRDVTRRRCNDEAFLCISTTVCVEYLYDCINNQTRHAKSCHLSVSRLCDMGFF